MVLLLVALAASGWARATLTLCFVLLEVNLMGARIWLARAEIVEVVSRVVLLDHFCASRVDL